MGNASLPCTEDTCDDDEGTCEPLSADPGDAGGCIAFEDFVIDDDLDLAQPGLGIGTAAAAAPIIDAGGTIILTTNKGIARIE